MTTYLMYDSANPSAIPRTAWAVAGYADGRYNWSAAEWESFLDSWRVSITVKGALGATVADCEPGAMSAPQTASWVKTRLSAGHRSTVYADAANHAAVARLLPMIPYAKWLADYDGKPVLPAGYVAKQYINPPRSGGDYDLSVVDPTWVVGMASVGGPPDTPPAWGPQTVIRVTVPGQPPMTTNVASLSGSTMPPGTVISWQMAGNTVTSDYGTLHDAGLL